MRSQHAPEYYHLSPAIMIQDALSKQSSPPRQSVPTSSPPEPSPISSRGSEFTPTTPDLPPILSGHELMALFPTRPPGDASLPLLTDQARAVLKRQEARWLNQPEPGLARLSGYKPSPAFDIMSPSSEPVYDAFQELFEWFQASESTDLAEPEEAHPTASDSANARDCNLEARTAHLSQGTAVLGDEGDGNQSSENVAAEAFSRAEAEAPCDFDADSDETRRRVDSVRLIMTIYSRLWVTGSEYARFHIERDAAFEIIELSQQYGGMERSLDDVHSRIRAWMLLNAYN
ncbi:hypothetical protein ONZ45_g16000 [Pleurotus djamor]|nr:hypothetical protein ONZ45_g16000 [Pleurotus djamor]